MGFLYLVILLVGIGCMLLIDFRFKLFFWHDPAVAMFISVIGVLLFVLWDLAGIAAGVFLRGESSFASGVVLAPEMPLEEPVFLLFLVLCIMVVFTGSMRLLAAIEQAARRSADQT